MKDLLSPQTKSKLSYLGYYQIIGGGIGLAIVIMALLSSLSPNTITVVITGSFFLFFGFSVLCGVLCVTGHKSALILSLINQLLQLVSITVAGISFSYVAGIYVIAGFDLTGNTELNLGSGISRIHFYILNDNSIIGFGFNLVAFGFIVWILLLMKKVKTEITVTSQFSDWK